MEEATQIGSYRVLRKIGEGGMGAVWLAEHAMLGRRAALKVLRPEYSNNSEVVTRFFNEARAATAVSDPGIVQIFDFGRHSDGSAYIVMELLDGEPLDRRLARQGALGLPDALRIMRQVASTLGAAHACGIVHRDLKPENVFIVRDPEVPGGERAKILDFGIAKLTDEHASIKTHTRAVMGTPPYMSPEQCRGAGQVDARSDVYALGCVLFALLVGRPPFDAEGIGDIIAMHLREPPPVPSSLRPGIPSNVDRLVLRCLAKDPAQRFEHGGDLAVALANLLASLPQGVALGPSAAFDASAIPTTLSSAAGASSTRVAGRGRAAALAGLGVVAIGGVISFMATRDDPAPASSEATPANQASEPPPPAPAPEEPDPGAEVAARAKAILLRFVAWSRDHRGAPCPEITALGAVPPDPWGHAFRLTCTDQPGDQIIGVISAGPDGVPGTADDIASWQLGREVTESARGARWVAAAPPPSVSASPEPGPSAGVRRVASAPKPAATRPASVKPAVKKPAEAGPVGTSPAETKPAVVKPAEPGPSIELDEFGLPKKR